MPALQLAAAAHAATPADDESLVLALQLLVELTEAQQPLLGRHLNGVVGRARGGPQRSVGAAPAPSRPLRLQPGCPMAPAPAGAPPPPARAPPSRVHSSPPARPAPAQLAVAMGVGTAPATELATREAALEARRAGGEWQGCRGRVSWAARASAALAPAQPVPAPTLARSWCTAWQGGPGGARGPGPGSTAARGTHPSVGVARRRHHCRRRRRSKPKQLGRNKDLVRQVSRRAAHWDSRPCAASCPA